MEEFHLKYSMFQVFRDFLQDYCILFKSLFLILRTKISFDPFAWKILNLVQWMPLESRFTPINFQVSWSKVKVKQLVFEKMLFIQYILTLSLESSLTWYSECP